MTTLVQTETLGLAQRFPGAVTADTRAGYTGWMVAKEHLIEVATAIHDEFGYDLLSSVTGVDYFPDKMEVVYQAYKTTGGPGIFFKVQVPRVDPIELPSVTPIWPGADFQEREIWDLYGIKFTGHPDLRRILLLGSGPIVIGQAAEFDYSGTQAVKALKEEGYEVILVNSNPATIMTDPELADRTYIEPVTPEWVRLVIERERPGLVILPATVFGRDLAPRVAARLGLGLTGECVDLSVDAAGRVLQHKPAFGGSVVALVSAMLPNADDTSEKAMASRPSAPTSAIFCTVPNTVMAQTVICGWSAK